MNDAIELAIKLLAERSGKEINATNAMQYAQAALNLSNAIATLDLVKDKASN